MKTASLLFLCNEDKICLAMKKRGFGEGKYNGVGGKREEGEHIFDTAVREAKEEICVDIHRDDITEVAQLHFHFDEKPEYEFHVHVFTTNKWKGEPIETDEMRPDWFHHKEIPFDGMWSDDIHWLPDVLGGKYIEATFWFESDMETIRTFEKKEK